MNLGWDEYRTRNALSFLSRVDDIIDRCPIGRYPFVLCGAEFLFVRSLIYLAVLVLWFGRSNAGFQDGFCCFRDSSQILAERNTKCESLKLALSTLSIVAI
jgi:hypothetical protein